MEKPKVKNSKNKKVEEEKKENFKWDTDFNDGIDNIYIHGASFVD